jgi:hypothetical protein
MFMFFLLIFLWIETLVISYQSTSLSGLSGSTNTLIHQSCSCSMPISATWIIDTLVSCVPLFSVTIYIWMPRCNLTRRFLFSYSDINFVALYYLYTSKFSCFHLKSDIRLLSLSHREFQLYTKDRWQFIEAKNHISRGFSWFLFHCYLCIKEVFLINWHIYLKQMKISSFNIFSEHTSVRNIDATFYSGWELVLVYEGNGNSIALLFCSL